MSTREPWFDNMLASLKAEEDEAVARAIETGEIVVADQDDPDSPIVVPAGFEIPEPIMDLVNCESVTDDQGRTAWVCRGFAALGAQVFFDILSVGAELEAFDGFTGIEGGG